MGSGTTARLGLEYPLSSDPTNIPGDMETVANQLDAGVSPAFAGVVVFLANTLALQPAAAVKGRWYYATDTGGFYWDTGSVWLGPFNSASILTTKGDVLIASGAGAFARLGVGTDGSVLTSRSTATNGVDWELAPAQQKATLAAHVVTSGNTALSGAITIPTGGAGTWAVKSKIQVVGASGVPTGASCQLLVNGSLYQACAPVLQPTSADGLFDLGLDIAGMAAAGTFQLEFVNPSGSAQNMTFAGANTQGDGGTNWFTATWLHA